MIWVRIPVGSLNIKQSFGFQFRAIAFFIIFSATFFIVKHLKTFQLEWIPVLYF